jgi:hypothetical protein
MLSYFLTETDEQNMPRGKVPLIGALVNPSDEDSKTFTISSSSGEQIKFKANDAKARQEWVDGLRSIVQSISSQSRSTKEHLATYDCLIVTRKQIENTERASAEVARTIESISSNDPDLLMLKALSFATTQTLSQAYTFVQRYNDAIRHEMY